MKLVEKLIQNRILSKEEFVELLSNTSAEDREILRKEAVRLREKYYGHDVYIRGLIEFTNYCKNNCYYCGIRRDNHHSFLLHPYPGQHISENSPIPPVLPMDSFLVYSR